MNFNRLAPFYGAMERFTAGEKMQRCRVAFLDQVPVPQSILTLGEGHGRFLVECLRRFPLAAITCVDASAGMLEQARRRLKTERIDPAGVKWIHADLLEWTPPGAAFDLIATHFFLDCFRADQLEVIVPRIASAGTPHSSWLLADFQVAHHGWRRLRSQAILAIMYQFFRVFARLSAGHLVPPDQFLQQNGFKLHRRIESEWGLLKSDWWTRS